MDYYYSIISLLGYIMIKLIFKGSVNIISFKLALYQIEKSIFDRLFTFKQYG